MFKDGVAGFVHLARKISLYAGKRLTEGNSDLCWFLTESCFTEHSGLCGLTLYCAQAQRVLFSSNPMSYCILWCGRLSSEFLCVFCHRARLLLNPDFCLLLLCF